MTGINKSFGPVHVLHDIDFAVYPGQVTALVGDNGAGKSTLVKCVAGIYASTAARSGSTGDPVTMHGPRDAAALGIEVVYQDLALCDNLDIVQNMFLGREIIKQRRPRRERDGAPRAQHAGQSLSVRTVKCVRQVVASLSGGQRQTVAIAKSVLWNSQGRPPRRADRRARRGPDRAGARRSSGGSPTPGIGVVLISHNMNDVLQVPTGSRSSTSAGSPPRSRPRT